MKSFKLWFSKTGLFWEVNVSARFELGLCNYTRVDL